MNTNDKNDPKLARFANALAPAYSATGQKCAQCGADAWHVELMHFCRSHDQNTLSRGIKRNGPEAYGVVVL